MMEDQPIHISSSLTSLVSQATLTDIQDLNNNTLHSFDKPLQSKYIIKEINNNNNNNNNQRLNDESEEEIISSPISIDLTSLWEATNNNLNRINNDPSSYLPSLKEKKNKSALKLNYHHQIYDHDILPLTLTSTTTPSIYHDDLSKMNSIMDNKNNDDGAIYIHIDDKIKPILHDDSSSIETKKKFLCVLGKSLINDGCPCYRVESVLKHCAKVLGLEASFTFLPDSILIAFTNNDYLTESMIVKTSVAFDTGKIGTTNKVINTFIKQIKANNDEDDDDVKKNDHKHNNKKEMNNKEKRSGSRSRSKQLPPSLPPHHFLPEMENCLNALNKIREEPPTCGFWGTLFAFSASAFAASPMLFSGSWYDACLSAFLGLIVGLLFVLSCKYPIYGRVFELSSSFLVAIIARAFHQYCCFSSVAISGIIILLPGYSMTISVMELSARNISTGTIKLVYSVVYSFILAYGLQVGSNMYSVIDPSASEPGVCDNQVPHFYYIPLFPILSIGISYSFGSSRSQWLTQMFCAAVGFCTSYFLSKVIPDGHMTNSIAAFTTGLYANFALKITGEAPLVPLCVGVTLLVPGSIGVRGAFASLLEDGVNHNFAVQMLTKSLGIAAGLYAAALIVYPFEKRRSLYVSL
ncbi:unnamed protein product [Cunninghamella blakesleeana]